MRSNILVALLFLLFICCIHFCNSVNTFDSERIKFMREMILANSEEERKKALANLEPYQKQDFKDIFAIME